ncbi:MAG: Undecaprenyl phosphate-alpha-4-amino-4-deoxy-L-arabinose arabinosyl transferase [Pseudomonas citronellolis]|nr:MAG: Undecaprenyl phosphate-alpha-4-amino-4-deoxy-L-arabinose arabinosyl transferase [Pseudomonas citronellolis]
MKYFRSEREALLLLLGVSALLLLCGLASREVWGPEGRWADISLRMLQTHDYLDPYLLSEPYYDKPLLSYWLIVLPAKLFGLNAWTLRASVLLAGWGSVWLVYWLGERLLRKGTGLLAGWLLATTFYFLFWARVATADVLTVFGMLAALAWYWKAPEDSRFSRYLGFCLLLSLTSLCKGLIGFILPPLALLPHLLAEGRWRRHLNLRLLAALLVAAAVYAIPFLLSSRYGQPTYGESGLGLVFRENVVRFFQPFDHMGPIYTYVLYLPIYTLPWAPLWLIGLWMAVRHWRQLSANERWLVWALGLLFLFFTASGSRRSYYVLPLVPFAQLLGAWWVVRCRADWAERRFWPRLLGGMAVLWLLVLGVAYPWSNQGGGIIAFAHAVRDQAERQAPWEDWRVVLLGNIDRKLPMYLGGDFARMPAFHYIAESADYPREGDSAAFFTWLDKNTGEHWDPQRTVVIGDFRRHEQLPLAYLGTDHQTLRATSNNGDRLFHQHGERSDP